PCRWRKCPIGGANLQGTLIRHCHSGSIATSPYFGGRRDARLLLPRPSPRRGPLHQHPRPGFRQRRRAHRRRPGAESRPTDDVGAACPTDRQKLLFDMVYAAATRSYGFKDKMSPREYFTKLTGLYKNLNYAAMDSNQTTTSESQSRSRIWTSPYLRS